MRLKSLQEINAEAALQTGIKVRNPATWQAAKPETRQAGEPETRQAAELETRQAAGLKVAKTDKAEPKAAKAAKPRKVAKKRGAFGAVINVIYYAIIAALLFSVYAHVRKTGWPKTVFGYSCYTVYTSDMQGEIPKDSLVVVRKTPAQELKTGDVITFALDKDNSATRKIAGILEGYEGSGLLGFETKGAGSADPDKEIVRENSVAGKVVCSLPGAGAYMARLGENLNAAFIVFGACALITLLAGIALSAKPKNKKQNERGILNENIA